MNRKSSLLLPPASRFVLFILLGLFLLPAAAQPVPPPLDRESFKLYVARNGDEVLLSWELPSDQIRGIEIYRNTMEDVKGRKRCGSARPVQSTAMDKLPDAGSPYWYWLKITFNDGQTMNVGPAPTPSAQVWTP